MAYKLIAAGITSLLLLSGCAAPVIVAGGAAAGAAASDRRTTGTVVEDQAIEFKANKAIYTNDLLKKEVHINVTSYNGSVLVTGEAPNENMRNAVINIVRRVEKVRRVYNEVIIAPQSPQLDRNRDTWITTKVKTALMTAQGVNGFNVKVTTSNKIVYLMGLVTQTEGNIAANVTREVEEVQQVVKLFEYQ